MAVPLTPKAWEVCMIANVINSAVLLLIRLHQMMHKLSLALSGKVCCVKRFLFTLAPI